MILDKRTFFDIQSKFQYVPFDQTEEWLNSLCLDENVIIYFVDNIEKPQLCCWGKIFKRLFIGKHLMIDGVSIKEGTTSDFIKIFYKEIISEAYGLIELSDNNFYDANFEVGIRRAGFTRPFGLMLSPLTMILKLQEPFAFHRNWRRNVKKSVERGVQFIKIDKPTIYEAKIFVELFNELKDRKQLGFSLTTQGLMHLFSISRYQMFFVKNNDGKYIAGRIEYINGIHAYDVLAANSNDAIKYGSVYFLQEEIFRYLKNIGVETFDFGRIPPSADKIDDIYVSKSYSGGQPISYNGQWQYSKSILLDYIYSFYKYYIHKQRRY